MRALVLACLAIGAVFAAEVSEELDARFRRLRTWLQAGIDEADHGAKAAPRLDEALRLADGRFGRSLVAARDFKAHDAIVLLPLSHVVHHREYSVGLESLPSHLQCAVYIARQRLAGEASRWKPFVDMLPSSHDLPRYWDQDLVQDYMRGSTFAEFVENEYTEMKSDWNRAYEATGGKAGGGIAWEDFKWGHDIYHTRSVWWDPKWTDEPANQRNSALFPFFDLLMHGTDLNADYTFDKELQAVKLYATRDIKEGEEVMITYFAPANSRSNLIILSKWGFAMDDAQKRVEIKLPKGRMDLEGKPLHEHQGEDDQQQDGNEPTYDLEQTARDGAAKAFLAHLRARANPQAISVDDLPEGWFGVPDPRTGWLYFWKPDTEEVLWTRPGDPDGHAKGPTYTPATTWGTEMKVLRAVKKLVEDALSNLPMTLQEDLDLLAGDIPNHRVRFMLMCRRDEKQTLHWWLHLVTNALARAPDPALPVDAAQTYLDPKETWYRPHGEL